MFATRVISAMFPNYLSGNNAGQNIIYRNFPQNCPKYEVGQSVIFRLDINQHPNHNGNSTKCR